MGWTPKIETEEYRNAAVGLVEFAKGLFDERYDRARKMELRLAEVFCEADIIEVIMGRLARNALGRAHKD